MPKSKALIGIAECARRTGLSVKAIRLYERLGLVQPLRSDKGWRYYGPDQLIRLNTILTLRTFGLSLAQIAGLLSASPLTLGQVLHLQMQTLRQRKRDAEQALSRVQAAVERLRTEQSLSIDELCRLARSLDMTNVHALMREFLNRNVTPEEERAYLTWWATRPTDDVTASRDFFEAQYQLFQSFKALQDRHVSPTDPLVQALVEQWRTLAHRCRARENVLAMLDWNSTIARKFMDAGARAVERDLSAGQRAELSAREYFLDALSVSPWGKAIEGLLQKAHALEREAAISRSTAMQKVVTRLEQLCVQYELGDPYAYARWAAATAATSNRVLGGLSGAERQRVWLRVAETLSSATASADS